MKFKIVGNNLTHGDDTLHNALVAARTTPFDALPFDRMGDTDHLEFKDDRMVFSDTGTSLRYGWYFEEVWIFENGRMFTAYGQCTFAEYKKMIKAGIKNALHPKKAKAKA